jgi:3-methyladenine DNA glycosylase AlkD
MTLKQTMAKLKSLGSAQTRKTYRRHRVTGDMFGVKYGDLEKLIKQIKVDHDLALALWETGNLDARVLATKIVDREQLTAKTLSAWANDVDNRALSFVISDLASGCDVGRKAARKWRSIKKEWPGATGWMALAGTLRLDPGSLTKNECRELLAAIEERIHGSPNWIKYSMNTALISMGSFVPGMEQEATRAANRIGQVEVDHGDTACKTPLAVPYIKKAAAHQRAKLAKASKKKIKKRSPRATAPGP